MIPAMTLAAELVKDIEHRFAYHPNLSDETGAAHDKIRSILTQATKDVLEVATEVAPYGREAALAVTAIEDADQWFHAHIARNQPVPEAPVAAETVIPAEVANATPSVAETAVAGTSTPSSAASVTPEPAAVEVHPVVDTPETSAVAPVPVAPAGPGPVEVVPTGPGGPGPEVQGPVDPPVATEVAPTGPTGSTSTPEPPAVDPTRTL